MTKKRKDQSDIDRKNKEIYSLIMDMGVALADLNYQLVSIFYLNYLP